MIIIVEYTKNDIVNKIAFDINGWTLEEAQEKLPSWLDEDCINYDSYKITTGLVSIIEKENLIYPKP